MKMLRCGVVILAIMLLLSSCGSKTGETTPTEETQEVTEETSEAKVYSIISAKVNTVPMTNDYGGGVGNLKSSFLEYITICYEDGDEVQFLSIPIINRNEYYVVHFQKGDEDKLMIEEGPKRGGGHTYHIVLTEETYQSIF